MQLYSKLKVKINIHQKIKKQNKIKFPNQTQSVYIMDTTVMLAYGLVGVIMIGAVMLAKRSEILRDKTTDLSGDVSRKPYSLSRVQLFVWTLIVACTFILGCAYKGTFTGIINNTALILMGISLATTVGGSIVDSTVSGSGNSIVAKEVLMNNTQRTQASLVVDVLSDSRGVSVHRFQAVVFNVIFAAIFLYKFARTGEFPEFGEQELTLMGISQAGYVGLKANEKPTPNEYSSTTPRPDEVPTSAPVPFVNPTPATPTMIEVDGDLVSADEIGRGIGTQSRNIDQVAATPTYTTSHSLEEELERDLESVHN